MTEQKRGRGRPKKIEDDPRMPKFKPRPVLPVPDITPYDWKDLAFKVQDALESSIQENKELEEKFQDVCTIAIKQQGVIEYLEGLLKKHKPTEEEIERNNDPV
jgi:hypothetical protein